MRDALVGVIQHLHHNPKLSIPCLLALTTGQIHVAEEVPDDTWHKSYNKVGDIPVYFKAQLLSAAEPLLTKALLNNVHEKDQLAIPLLFNNAIQVGDHVALTGVGKRHSLGSRIFLMRMSICGDRPKKWMQRQAVANDGTVSHKRASCFQALWENHQCTQMDYNGVDSVKITSPFSDKMDFNDALLCMAAHYKEGAHCLRLEELFAAGTGPHRLHVANTRNIKDNVFVKLKEQLDGTPLAQQPQPVVPDPQFLSGACSNILQGRKTKAAERLQKARSDGTLGGGKKRKVERAASG